MFSQSIISPIKTLSQIVKKERNKSIQGIKLIHSLDNYAETGEEYTKILAQIIEQNSLSDFEGVKLTNSVVRKELQL